MNYEQFQNQLHEDALELMSKFDDKYNMYNTLSLDEYLFEYCDLLTNDEQLEICNVIDKFNRTKEDFDNTKLNPFKTY
tara:strand:- start:691 stop:924 length:234 start_codon:yes stop_codon:yes gene_type:complete